MEMSAQPDLKLEEIKKAFLEPERWFAVSEARYLIECVLSQRLELTGRFHNEFYYEILPIILICEHLGNEVGAVQFTGRQTRFDGIIKLEGRHSTQRIEMTAAIDGYNDALISEFLRKHGRAPALVPIEATGTKQNRTFGENRLEAVASSDVEKAINHQIFTTFNRKLEKAKSNQAYDGAWLGLVVEDWKIPFDKRKRLDPICESLIADGPECFSPFSRVFFVGISSDFNYIFDSQIA